ncbi:ExbD/TolR family protein [Phenylobacterium sp.]|uniref:ExbD/TolR family protein n=1 Tax=Phenylobacterium sp. TaxID=1871053 RepID=UPI0027355BCB|nr:ExbD/TolR family protein [Phenylobacterium sp.]MDP3855442.1 ExbD/TolR family protein [Phenylobacterium sp.]
MALSAHDAFSASGGSRRRRSRRTRGALAEINVTPLVDVMLVLLIIFMVSAPLLTVGVPVELPKTEAGAMEDDSEPLTVSIRQDGALYIQEDPVSFAGMAPRLRAMVGDVAGKPIYVRADGKASYEIVAQVMAALSTSGFTSINLITDTGGPSSGGDARKR